MTTWTRHYEPPSTSPPLRCVLSRVGRVGAPAMLIVVANVLPKFEPHADLDQAALRVERFRDDPVIAHLLAETPFAELASRAADISEDFTATTMNRAFFDQWILAAIWVRSLVLTHAERVTGVIGYCSGMLPTLCALGAIRLTGETQTDLPQSLTNALARQHLNGLRNVKLDTCIATLNFTGAAWSASAIDDFVVEARTRGVHLSERRGAQVLSFCALRPDLDKLLDDVRARQGREIRCIAARAHRGFHTALAVEPDFMECDDDARWPEMRQAIADLRVPLGSSAGEWLGPADDHRAMQRLLRRTMFAPVQNQRLVEIMRARDEDYVFVGHSAAVAEMFLGTGYRPKKSEIVSQCHL